MQFAAYIAVIGYCASSVAIGETTQIAVGKFPYAFILAYINTVQLLTLTLVIPIWKYYRSYFNLTTNIISKEKKAYNTFAWFLCYSILSGILTSSLKILINISLQAHVITVPTSSAISGMKPVFVLILSVLLINEKLDLWMIMAMVLAIGGGFLFVLELLSSNQNYHNNDTYDTYYGILLTILWTLLTSIRSIITAKTRMYCFEKDKIVIGTLLYVIYMSLTSTLLFWWNLFYPKQIDMDSLTINDCFWVLMNGFITVVLLVCVNVSITLKSPFYISIAATLVTPISFVVDMFVHHYKPNLYAICGAVLILVSFLMLEIIKPNDRICSFFKFCNVVLINKDVKDDKDENIDLVNELEQESICKQSKVINEYSDELMDKT